jgi:hypothetical protein
VSAIRRGMCMTIVVCVLAGCGDSGGSGEATATVDNPQAGLDAMKKWKETNGPVKPLEKKAKTTGKH